ncbi:MAG TPA: 3-oxoacyl-[acyl-carrier-protein] synthase III C-terminal domain-containing protein [Longimicrobiaceae bacterium]|nr:3-oxoacyl-[acyl-carrier-protein] synthase III C-terminal domain-containing protein [Longimicrobiaceae bacterium]
MKACIATTATVKPEYFYTQESLAALLRKYCLAMGYEFDLEVIDSLFENAMIQGRHFALPLDNFYDPPTRGELGRAGIEVALGLCEQAVRTVLDRAGLGAEQVSMMTSMMTTVFSVPTIDARLMNRLPFPRSLKRIPLSGLGCMSGAAGVSRVADYLDGHPDQAAILLSCELGGSAFWQGGLQGYMKDTMDRLAEDPTAYRDLISQLVAAALFGDGVAAVLMVGRDHPLAGDTFPRVADTRSITVADSEHVMGVDVLDSGFMNVLSPDVPEYARGALRDLTSELLGEHGLEVSDVKHWIVHPGGPKVLDAVEEGLGLDAESLRLSRDVLWRIGNVSAPTVLYMLEESLNGHRPAAGSTGLLLAMGPGFSEEAVLLQW